MKMSLFSRHHLGRFNIFIPSYLSFCEITPSNKLTDPTRVARQYRGNREWEIERCIGRSLHSMQQRPVHKVSGSQHTHVSIHLPSPVYCQRTMLICYILINCYCFSLCLRSHRISTRSTRLAIRLSLSTPEQRVKRQGQRGLSRVRVKAWPETCG